MLKTPVPTPESKHGLIRLRETEGRGHQGLGQGEREPVFNGCQVSIGDDEKLREIDCGNSCTTLAMHVMPLYT